jgi:hypothetical protein
VWAPGAPGLVAIESPHTVSDWRLGEVAVDVFLRSGARALLVAGAGRWAGGDTGKKSTDPADVANYTGPTVFQAVHESLLDVPDLRFVQLHGNDRAPEDIVVSNGDAAPVPLVRRLAAAYEGIAAIDGVRLFADTGGSGDTELTARRNPQGVTARAAGAPWAHVELSRPVRESEEVLEDVISTTTSVLTTKPRG